MGSTCAKEGPTADTTSRRGSETPSAMHVVSDKTRSLSQAQPSNTHLGQQQQQHQQQQARKENRPLAQAPRKFFMPDPDPTQEDTLSIPSITPRALPFKQEMPSQVTKQQPMQKQPQRQEQPQQQQQRDTRPFKLSAHLTTTQSAQVKPSPAEWIERPVAKTPSPSPPPPPPHETQEAPRVPEQPVVSSLPDSFATSIIDEPESSDSSSFMGQLESSVSKREVKQSTTSTANFSERSAHVPYTPPRRRVATGGLAAPSLTASASPIRDAFECGLVESAEATGRRTLAEAEEDALCAMHDRCMEERRRVLARPVPTPLSGHAAPAERFSGGKGVDMPLAALARRERWLMNGTLTSSPAASALEEADAETAVGPSRRHADPICAQIVPPARGGAADGLVDSPSPSTAAPKRVGNGGAWSRSSPHPRRPQLAPPTHALYESGSLATSSVGTTAATSCGGVGGGKRVCRWCTEPYEGREVCAVALELHSVLRQQRKEEKRAKKRAQELLREGNIQEAMGALHSVGLI